MNTDMIQVSFIQVLITRGKKQNRRTGILIILQQNRMADRQETVFSIKERRKEGNYDGSFVVGGAV